jgi:hypothetical protein
MMKCTAAAAEARRRRQSRGGRHDNNLLFLDAGWPVITFLINAQQEANAKGNHRLFVCLSVRQQFTFANTLLIILNIVCGNWLVL